MSLQHGSDRMLEAKVHRLEELMDVQRGSSLDRNLDQSGRRTGLLVDSLWERDEAEGDFVGVGRTEKQAPDIDGVTHLLAVEGAEGPLPTRGQTVTVEIVDAAEHDLIAQVVAT